MDRQGSSGSSQRQSSLPSNLHRLMVPDPSPPRRSATQDPSLGASGSARDDLLVASSSRPIPSVPGAHGQIPSVVLTHADFAERSRSSERAPGGRQSVSPALGAAVHDPGAASRSALPLIPPPPPRGERRKARGRGRARARPSPRGDGARPDGPGARCPPRRRPPPPAAEGRPAAAEGDKSLCRGLILNRSQRGSCSATYETLTQNQVVYE